MFRVFALCAMSVVFNAFSEVATNVDSITIPEDSILLDSIDDFGACYYRGQINYNLAIGTVDSIVISAVAYPQASGCQVQCKKISGDLGTFASPTSGWKKATFSGSMDYWVPVPYAGKIVVQQYSAGEMQQFAFMADSTRYFHFPGEMAAITGRGTRQSAGELSLRYTKTPLTMHEISISWGLPASAENADILIFTAQGSFVKRLGVNSSQGGRPAAKCLMR